MGRIVEQTSLVVYRQVILGLSVGEASYGSRYEQLFGCREDACGHFRIIHCSHGDGEQLIGPDVVVGFSLAGWLKVFGMEAIGQVSLPGSQRIRIILDKIAMDSFPGGLSQLLPTLWIRGGLGQEGEGKIPQGLDF